MWPISPTHSLWPILCIPFSLYFNSFNTFFLTSQINSQNSLPSLLNQTHIFSRTFNNFIQKLKNTTTKSSKLNQTWINFHPHFPILPRGHTFGRIPFLTMTTTRHKLTVVPPPPSDHHHTISDFSSLMLRV